MWKSGFMLIFAVPVFSNADCSGCDPGSSTPVDTATPDPCEDFVPLATAAELAATPRSNPSTELLAIELEPGLTARAGIFDRLDADLRAIWGASPAIDGIGYRAPHDGRTLLVGMEAASLDAVAAGTYDAWDCANEAYGLLRVQPGSSWVLLELEGTYDLDALAAEYAALPGVTYAEPNLRMGGGSSVCVDRDGETWHYVFDVAWGDCQSGCTDHEYHHFSTEPDGTVTGGESWYDHGITPPPAWLEDHRC